MPTARRRRAQQTRWPNMEQNSPTLTQMLLLLFIYLSFCRDHGLLLLLLLLLETLSVARLRGSPSKHCGGGHDDSGAATQKLCTATLYGRQLGKLAGEWREPNRGGASLATGKLAGPSEDPENEYLAQTFCAMEFH